MESRALRMIASRVAAASGHVDSAWAELMLAFCKKYEGKLFGMEDLQEYFGKSITGDYDGEPGLDSSDVPKIGYLPDDPGVDVTLRDLAKAVSKEYSIEESGSDEMRVLKKGAPRGR